MENICFLENPHWSGNTFEQRNVYPAVSVYPQYS